MGIPQKDIDLIHPTKEALDSCYMMVMGYAKTYPQEEFKEERCEIPLRFPLIEGMDGLAKVDNYFYVPSLTEVESGIEGVPLTLTPGWWIREYKTKSPSIDLSLWMKKWEVNQQASFQILSLREKVKDDLREGVQGILISIIEKPIIFIPKRKCKVCEIQYEFGNWIPTLEGLHSCPICGNVQKLLKVKEDPSESPPKYYRMVVTRREETLRKDFRDFQDVALQIKLVKMKEEMALPSLQILNSLVWNKELCVDTSHKKVCQYFEPHLNGRDTREMTDEFEEVEDYVGELEKRDPLYSIP